MRRLALRSGRHAQAFHQVQAHNLTTRTLEMDERHGYVESKSHQHWDALSIDAHSKFIVQLEVGERNESLFEDLMRHSAGRLANPQDLRLMTDGAASYSSLFPAIFGIAYFPPRQGSTGRVPNPRYRIHRTLAQAQVIKRHSGKRLMRVETMKAHGSWKRIHQGKRGTGLHPT